MADNDLIQRVHEKCISLYFRLLQTQTNLNKIVENIKKWSSEPLHRRSLYGKNILEIRYQKERLHNRLLHCAETQILIKNVIFKNFGLIFNTMKEDFPQDLTIDEVMYI